jgi:SAM-dependent methyltransferase
VALQPAASALVAAVARRFAAAGYFATYFARGKLRRDPIFFELLRRGAFPDGARVLDLGCGQGILLALLAAASDPARAGVWPEGWAKAPESLSLSGIELRASEVTLARIALGADARIEQGDLRTVRLGAESADRIALFDVIHYLEPEAQDALLARCAAALAPRGVLLLRVCDAAVGWRAHLTRVLDRVGTLSKGGAIGPLHLRSAAAWQAALEKLGLAVSAEPMSEGTPFANVLLSARRESAARRAP